MRLKTSTAATTAETMDLVCENHGETAIIVLTHRLSVGGGIRVTATNTVGNFTSIGSRHLTFIQFGMARRLGGAIAVSTSALLTFFDISITPLATNEQGQINSVSLARSVMTYTMDTKDTALRTEATIWC